MKYFSRHFAPIGYQFFWVDIIWMCTTTILPCTAVFILILFTLENKAWHNCACTSCQRVLIDQFGICNLLNLSGIRIFSFISFQWVDFWIGGKWMEKNYSSTDVEQWLGCFKLSSFSFFPFHFNFIVSITNDNPLQWHI